MQFVCCDMNSFGVEVTAEDILHPFARELLQALPEFLLRIAVERHAMPAGFAALAVELVFGRRYQIEQHSLSVLLVRYYPLVLPLSIVLIIEIAAGILLAKIVISVWEDSAEQFEESPIWGWIIIGIAIVIFSILEWK